MFRLVFVLLGLFLFAAPADACRDGKRRASEQSVGHRKDRLKLFQRSECSQNGGFLQRLRQRGSDSVTPDHKKLCEPKPVSK